MSALQRALRTGWFRPRGSRPLAPFRLMGNNCSIRPPRRRSDFQFSPNNYSLAQPNPLLSSPDLVRLGSALDLRLAPSRSRVRSRRCRDELSESDAILASGNASVCARLGGCRAGCLRIRCGRQQLKKKPPGRSPDGSFRNCRHGVGSIALLISAGPPPPKATAAVPHCRVVWPERLLRWPIPTTDVRLNLKIRPAIVTCN
jgi:hypothetical protein